MTSRQAVAGKRLIEPTDKSGHIDRFCARAERLDLTEAATPCGMAAAGATLELEGCGSGAAALCGAVTIYGKVPRTFP